MTECEGRPHYELRGAALELMKRTDRELILAGPAGTGKSLACLLKMHILCEEVSGCRALMLRKTRVSLSESAMLTYERDVYPQDKPVSRMHRTKYEYPNGSEIVIGGLDKPEKLFSTEYNVIYVQEAIEITEPEWESLFRALRAKGTRYNQIIADTNPGAPTHWIRQRSLKGSLTMLESRHEDNPRFFRADGTPTPEGVEYIAILDAMTGTRRERLRHGRWVQAEGVVYDEWDARKHLGIPPQLRKDHRVIISVDFGYNNPFVAQWWLIDHDGVMWLYREYVRTGMIVEDHAKAMREFIGADVAPVRAIVCDHDAEDRATLERHLRLRTTAAWKSIMPGIEMVKRRLRGPRPRLMVSQSALVGRDRAMSEAKLPIGMAEEMDAYVWHESKDMPVDENNHSADAARYAVAHVDRRKAPGASSVVTGGRKW